MTRPKAVMGIDPGAKGAVCAMTLDKEEIKVLGFNAGECEALRELVKEYRIERAFLEKVSAMPGWGVTSTFSFGEAFGRIQGWLTAMMIPFELVTPRVWQKDVHAGTSGDDPKAKSLAAARRLFPTVDLTPGKCRKPQDGLVDALLIAEFGRRKTK